MPSVSAPLVHFILIFVVSVSVGLSFIPRAFAVEPVTGGVIAGLPVVVQEELPLYEIGLGLGASYAPHYPGSDEYRIRALPFPWGVYRGSIIYSDRRGGTRARLLRTDRLELSFSGAGNFPVKPGENEAREGMPGQGWIGQLGPRLIYRFVTFPRGGSIRAGLSARMVFSTDNFTDFDHEGWVYLTDLVFDYPRFALDTVGLFVVLSAVFSDEHYASFIYGVPDTFATPARPAFDARRGLMYSDIITGISWRPYEGRHRFTLVTSGTSLHGAANEGSPLLRTKTNLQVGLVWIAVLFQSKEKVPVDD